MDKALLALNALLGAGTVLAPVFVALFVGLGRWWGLPVLVAVMIVGMLFFSAPLPLRANTGARGTEPGCVAIPARFWAFAAFALLYGVCETMNGNWAPLYMMRESHADTGQAALALTAFWGTVTVGRILFAAIGKWLSDRIVCRALPLLLAGSFVAIALLRPSGSLPGIGLFALAGLGCSALLPLAISFGQAELSTMSEAVAGGLIAFYQIGYGIAAFGVGPLQARAGLGLGTIFGGTTIVALLLAGFAWLVARRPAALDLTPPRARS